MPHVTCYCLAYGEKDRFNNLGLIFRVEGFKEDILVTGYCGNDGETYWLFILN